MCDDARLTTPPEAYITVSTSRVVVVVVVVVDDEGRGGADPKEGVGTRVGRGAVEGETAARHHPPGGDGGKEDANAISVVYSAGLHLVGNMEK